MSKQASTRQLEPHTHKVVASLWRKFSQVSAFGEIRYSWGEQDNFRFHIWEETCRLAVAVLFWPCKTLLKTRFFQFSFISSLFVENSWIQIFLKCDLDLDQDTYTTFKFRIELTSIFPKSLSALGFETGWCILIVALFLTMFVYKIKLFQKLRWVNVSGKTHTLNFLEILVALGQLLMRDLKILFYIRSKIFIIQKL